MTYQTQPDFVPPTTFAEFYSRYPEYARKTAFSVLHATSETLDDLEQSVWLLLLNNKIIERYDPAKVGGSTAGKFFSYLGLCVSRKGITAWRNGQRDGQTHALAIMDDAEEGYTEDTIHAEMADQPVQCDPTVAIYRQQLCDYIRRRRSHNTSELIVIAGMLADGLKNRDIAEELGIRATQASAKVQRVRQLAREFAGRHGGEKIKR